MSATETVVVAEHISKRVATAVGELRVLDEIDVQLAAGQSLAIIGESGSGKTTLLSLLAGLEQPTSGQIRLFGSPLSGLDEDGRAALRLGRVGFVFQAFHLLPSFTALENVAAPLELAGLDNPLERARVALERVGLGQRLTHLPRQLSGGEQQRVALARAFAIGPRLLFADEPTGNLDQRTGERVAELLFEINRSYGTSLVLVTHDPRLAARCQHQIHLEAGRRVA
ncbi:MAG: ABC transporter ATP-binding protein [Xanthomonadales bacterium]|nr:Lipoprotein-releasing system ATP-binding protein LolD [Xanthomonadales bacterium]MCC6593062.1 ABC transporter ATP-binding protein [Xanthomonadales bacterium]MCE7930366.1 ATP-binding cassette domain-containing protein [Xanthomonadales bacterium PRO6]